MALTQISTQGIKDGTISSADLANDSVITSKLAADAVTGAKIADDAVDNEHLAANSVRSEQIQNTKVTLAKLPLGTSSSDGKFLRANNGGQPTFETVNTDLVSDTSPQLGGDLDTNGHEISLDDDHKVKFGASNDLQIYHDGSHSYVKDAGTGNLRITSDSNIWIEHGTENMIVCNGDGSVELYHDNSKKLETYSGGVNIFGRVAPNEFQISDNEKAYFGTGLDLEIYHDGTNSHIANDTNALIIRSDALRLNNGGNTETMIKADADGAVELYYNNSKKLETTSEGIQTAEKIGMKYSSSQTNLRQTFYQQIAASGSHTFQVGNVYGMGTVTTFGSRGPTSPNATLATGKIFPIHVRAGATAGLGSQIGNDLGGASGGFSYSVAAASQGITVTNGSSSFAINVFVTFDLTGFV